jgi:hypothetical protein
MTIIVWNIFWNWSLGGAVTDTWNHEIYYEKVGLDRVIGVLLVGAV